VGVERSVTWDMGWEDQAADVFVSLFDNLLDDIDERHLVLY
jgi:hypothetical protein